MLTPDTQNAIQRAALSPATKQAYATGSKRYMVILQEVFLHSQPQLTMCYFAVYLSKQVQHATIRLYIAAVQGQQLIQRPGGHSAAIMAPVWCLKTVQDQNLATNLPKVAAAVNPEQ